MSRKTENSTNENNGWAQTPGKERQLSWESVVSLGQARRDASGWARDENQNRARTCRALGGWAGKQHPCYSRTKVDGKTHGGASQNAGIAILGDYALPEK